MTKTPKDRILAAGLIPGQADIERQRDGLLLHRTRVMNDIENCHGTQYRQTLKDGLAYLETRLVALGWQR